MDHVAPPPKATKAPAKESSAKPAKAIAKKLSVEPQVPESLAVQASVEPKLDNELKLDNAPPVQIASAPIEVDEPETPLSELDEPEPAAPLPTPALARPMPRIKLKMPKASVAPLTTLESDTTSRNGTDTVPESEIQGSETAAGIDSVTSVASPVARPRRAAARQPVPASPVTTRPIRSNARARGAPKPAPAANPATRTLRSRRGDKTEEELQKEREKAEAIREALDSGDEDQDGIEESL